MPLIQRQSDIFYVRKSVSKRTVRRLKFIVILILVFAVLCLLFLFIGFPIIFMHSLTLQRFFMFTNWNLPSENSYYKKYEIIPGLRNLYVSVNDLNSNKIISLGVWHILPFVYRDDVITDLNFDFDYALMHGNGSAVLLYFHGTGEDRSTSLEKYNVLKGAFHIITFDYRSYGDSTKAELSEDAVVNDCVQLYEWLLTRTFAPIYLWGHSLGTALATRTAAILQSKPNVTQPVGLILEAPFTRMSEELYVHPYGKIFAWLPWFKATVIDPLEKNGFIFDTRKHILNVESPIMILSSQDDNIVPYKFGKELYQIAKKRTGGNESFYYEFAYNLGYEHNFIYLDPYLPFFVSYFRYICTKFTGEEPIYATVNKSKSIRKRVSVFA